MSHLCSSILKIRTANMKSSQQLYYSKKKPLYNPNTKTVRNISHISLRLTQFIPILLPQAISGNYRKFRKCNKLYFLNEN